MFFPNTTTHVFVPIFHKITITRKLELIQIPAVNLMQLNHRLRLVVYFITVVNDGVICTQSSLVSHPVFIKIYKIAYIYICAYQTRRVKLFVTYASDMAIGF